jgi:hypothetical protein
MKSLFGRGCRPPFRVAFNEINFVGHAGEESNVGKEVFAAGAHCDWGFSPLLATDGVPGLQVDTHHLYQIVDLYVLHLITKYYFFSSHDIVNTHVLG